METTINAKIKKGGFGNTTFERDNFKYQLSLYIDVPDTIVEEYVYDNIEHFKKILFEAFHIEELFDKFFWNNEKLIALFKIILTEKDITIIKAKTEEFIETFHLDKSAIMDSE